MPTSSPPPTAIGETAHEHRDRRDLQGVRHHAALHPVSLSIPSGTLVALLGPSGSGKTTLLRILGGLEFPTAGRVLFDGQDATGSDRAGAPRGLRVPVLRPVPAHDGVRQHRLRPARPPAQDAPPEGRDRPAGDEAAGPDQAARHRRALPEPALGRPAPARGAGPRAGHRAADAAARRTLRRARRQGAQGTAPGPARHPRHHRASPPSSSPTTRTRRWNSPISSSSCRWAGSSRSAAPRTSAPARTDFVRDFITGRAVSRHSGLLREKLGQCQKRTWTSCTEP
jgi:energy-coupling factor transporter ATP-binding protein EcfA2